MSTPNEIVLCITKWLTNGKCLSADAYIDAINEVPSQAGPLNSYPISEFEK